MYSVVIFNNSFNRTPPHNNVSYHPITVLYVIVPRCRASIPAFVKQRRLLNDVRIRVHVCFSEQLHSCSYCLLIHLNIKGNLPIPIGRRVKSGPLENIKTGVENPSRVLWPMLKHEGLQPPLAVLLASILLVVPLLQLGLPFSVRQ